MQQKMYIHICSDKWKSYNNVIPLNKILQNIKNYYCFLVLGDEGSCQEEVTLSRNNSKKQRREENRRQRKVSSWYRYIITKLLKGLSSEMKGILFFDMNR